MEYTTDTGARFKRHSATTIELLQNSLRASPKYAPVQAPPEQLEERIRELKQRLKQGQSMVRGTAKALIVECQQVLCKLGMKPKEVERRIQTALGRGQYKDVQEFITAVFKEV